MPSTISFLYIAKDKFSSIAKRINRVTDKQRGKFKTLSKQFKKTGREFRKMSSGMMSGFKGIATAAIAFVSIRGFIQKGEEFQDAMADLSAITGAAGKELNALENNIFDLSKTFATRAPEVANAFKLVASAKPDLLENLTALTATTDQVLLLKNAAGIGLSSAANITAQALNIFGANADQAGRFVNVLAAGAKLGSSEIADTGEAMLIAGPAAKAAGLNFESLNAAIQTVAISGIKGARAGTALNAIFGRLRRAGIDFEKIGLQGAFELLGNKLNSVTDSTSRARLEAKLFGEEHSKVGLALIDNFRHLGKYERTLKGTNIAQEQANIRLNTSSAKGRKLGAVISEILIRSFKKLEPTISKLTETLIFFFDNMDTGAIDSMVSVIGLLIKGMGVLLDVAIAVAAVFKGIGTAIGELAGQIATLNFSVGTGLMDAFSVGGKLFGLFDNEESAASRTGNLTGASQSRTDVNVNLRGPERAIESVKSRTTGDVSGLNVGVNMAMGL